MTSKFEVKKICTTCIKNLIVLTDLRLIVSHYRTALQAIAKKEIRDFACTYRRLQSIILGATSQKGNQSQHAQINTFSSTRITLLPDQV